jgi:mannose-6-phosphate isomerase-like protein (cupin superfamily)
MVTIITEPVLVAAAGNPPKRIQEFAGMASTGSAALSLARMRSPRGWSEPGQTPEFDEYTLVLSGMVQVETHAGIHRVSAGQAVLAPRGEWIRYSTPEGNGAEYVSVCLPAFTPQTVHRDESD